MAADELDPTRRIDGADMDTADRVAAVRRAQAAAASSAATPVEPVAPTQGSQQVAPTAGLSDDLVRADALGEDMTRATQQVAADVDAREAVHDAAMHGSDLALAIQLAGAGNVAAAGAGAPLRTEHTAVDPEEDRYKVRKVTSSPREEHAHDENEDPPDRQEQDERRLDSDSDEDANPG